jgi:protein-S-isoprenylcysteine O-methyltransferase Ste14
VPFLAIAILAINAAAILFDLVVLSSERRKASFLALPVVVQKLFVVVVVAPLFIAAVVPQQRFELRGDIAWPAGLLLLALGVVVIVLAFARIGAVPSLRQKSHVVTTGIYGWVRHPIYSGTLAAVLGWVFITRSTALGFYFPVLIGLYLAMAMREEKVLVVEYGEEYVRYQKQVAKRLIPWVV